MLLWRNISVIVIRPYVQYLQSISLKGIQIWMPESEWYLRFSLFEKYVPFPARNQSDKTESFYKL